MHPSVDFFVCRCRVGVHEVTFRINTCKGIIGLGVREGDGLRDWGLRSDVYRSTGACYIAGRLKRPSLPSYNSRG